MEKLTLLQMTQNILSAMNSDEVNSITDTVESMQVAEEIHNTFRDLYTDHDVAQFEGIINLDSPANTATPNILTLPDNVQELRWLKYRDFRNTAGPLIYNELIYLDPDMFVRMIVDAPDPASYVLVPIISTSSNTFPIPNNQVPKYYTIFLPDQAIVTDGFDQTYESFLTPASSLAWGVQYETFTMDDNFIPSLPANEFPQLLAEAKAACFINIKQEPNQLETVRARHQRVASMRRRSIVPGQSKGALTSVDYSRKR